MKDILDPTEFQKGHVYCALYIGTRGPSANKTFRVIETKPRLEVEILHAAYGSPFSDEVSTGTITYPEPKLTFAGYQLYEPENKSEWFIQGIRLNSLSEAIDAKIITTEYLQKMVPHARSFMTCSDVGIYFSFPVKGTQEYPYLQSLFVLWKNYSLLVADFAKHGIEISL